MACGASCVLLGRVATGFLTTSGSMITSYCLGWEASFIFRHRGKMGCSGIGALVVLVVHVSIDFVFVVGELGSVMVMMRSRVKRLRSYSGLS